MSKLINARTSVKTRLGKTGEPLPWKLEVGGRWVEVKRVIDTWREVGSWWRQEAEKQFYLVELAESAGGGTYELYCDEVLGWGIYRVMD